MAGERILSIKAPVDDLVLQSFSGRESLSRLFQYQLSFLSQDREISASKLVGKQVSIKLLRDDQPPRYWNGYISRMSAGETVQFASGQGQNHAYRTYRAEMVPWLWLLTKRARCFIYHIDKTDDPKPLQDILKKLLTDAGFNSHYDDSGIKRKREIDYCVQYRETDFNFLSRLLEQYGVYYYFKHTESDHKLILADSSSGYGDCPESTVKFPPTTSAQFDHVTSWQHDYQFVSGKWSHTDYNFEDPGTDLLNSTPSSVSLQGLDKYEVYDYPGEYAKSPVGKEEADIRIQEEEAQYNVVVGSSACKTFSPGLRFKLEEHEIAAENAKYVITSVEHSMREGGIPGSSGGATYSNSFTCIPDSVTYRPPRVTPKPVISGVQTAVVVGKKGEEIDTDKYGRVKVLFHWDREGRKKEDQTCSCWIRVSQMIAGKKWGFMAIPRIGQEVIVEFLEGDPDRPVITGCLYNAQQMPGYDLPDDKTKIYLKSNSSKDDSGFNELMFEDKKGDERVFIHAQKNMDVRVKNDSKERVYGNFHQIVGYEKDGEKGGDRREMIYQDNLVNVKRHLVEHVEGNYQLMVGAGEAEDGGKVAVVIEKQIAVAIGAQGLSVAIEGDKKEGIDGSRSLTVVGDVKEKVGSMSLTVDGEYSEKALGYSLDVGMDQHMKAGMGAAWEAGMTMHLKAGMSLVLEAGVQLSLKVGGSFIDIGPAMISIQAPMVNINSGGAAGSGSGSKPKAPKAPEPPEKNVEKAKPTKPDKAHDSKGGTKSSK